jgi:hypothetical protein
VDRPVVAGRHLAGQGVTRDAHGPKDRTKTRRQETGAPLGFVDSRDAEAAECVNENQVGALRAADNNSHTCLLEVDEV